MDPTFGSNEREVNDGFNQIVSKAPRLKSTQAQMLLRDSYETTHHIFDHNSNDGQDSMALIRMHWSEDMVTNGRLHQWIKKFAKHRIGTIFNVSLPDFLEQPTYMCELMYEVASSKEISQNAEADELLKKLSGSER